MNTVLISNILRVATGIYFIYLSRSKNEKLVKWGKHKRALARQKFCSSAQAKPIK